MKRILLLPLWLSFSLAITFGLQNCKKPAADPVTPKPPTTNPGSSTSTAATTLPGVSTATAPTTSGITSTSATASAVITDNGGAAISQYGFVYSKTSQAPTLADSKTELGTTSGPFPLTITSKLTSLDPNSTYYVRAYATNDKGTGYGATAQVKTTEVAVVSNSEDAETIYVGSNFYTYAFDAATGKQKGQYAIEGSAYAAPTVDKTMLYTGYSTVVAFDGNTGRRVWEYSGLNGTFTEAMTVDNGVLYVPTESKLVALDAISSTKKWEFSATGGNSLTSPVVINGTVYLVGGAGMYALNAATGTRKWTYPAVQTGVAISGGIAYATGAPNTLHAVDIATGAKKWSYQMGTTLGSLGSCATVVNNTVYVGSGDKRVYAVDANTGAKKWDFLAGGDIYSSPFVAYGLVFFFSSDANLYAVDATTGTKKWNAKVGTTGTVLGSTSPVVVNSVVYIAGENKTLYAFDAVTGTEKWRVTTAQNLTSSPTVVAKNGKVFNSGKSGAQQ